jgi:hypothetical protein
MSYCFQRIRDVGEIKHRGKEGVKRMRKVLKRHRADKLKKFLNLWFTNGLKPMKTKKQTYEVSWRLRAKNPMLTAFYTW